MFLPSFLLLLISTIIAISSTNWIIIWISIEINLLSFIPLLILKKGGNEQSVILYFLSQALGSAIFIFAGSIYYLGISNSLFTTIILFSLFIKAGIAPCHFWLPIVILKASWFNCFILSTWQKIAPLFIIVLLFSGNSRIIKIIIPLNAIWGGLIGINQLHIKKIIAYSSITHIRWILTGIFLKIPCLTIFYFSIYSVILIIIIILLSNSSYVLYKDLWRKSHDNNLDYLICISLLSLGGLPPLLGFFPKLLLIYYLIPFHIPILICMLLGSLLNLFFYLNIRLNTFIKGIQINISVVNIKPYFLLNSIISMLSLLPLLLILL